MTSPARFNRAALDPLLDPVLRAYRESWRRVVDEQAALALDPARWRRRARLVEIRRSIEREMDTLDATSREWLSTQFPAVYSIGAVAVLQDVPSASTFTWTTPHREAVQRLADGLYRDLLTATTNVRDSTKALLRAVAKDRLLAKAIEGNTAKATGREMARLLANKGVYGVVYSNGARVGLGAYSEMAIRTVSATAYNQAGVTAGRDEGVAWFECFDGIGCGWEYHDAPDQANGKIVNGDDAMAYTISHPNCRRAFGPRPDLVSPADARAAQATTRPEQNRAQLASQLARGEKVTLSRAEARKLGALGTPGVTVRPGRAR